MRVSLVILLVLVFLFLVVQQVKTTQPLTNIEEHNEEASHGFGYHVPIDHTSLSEIDMFGAVMHTNLLNTNDLSE